MKKIFLFLVIAIPAVASAQSATSGNADGGLSGPEVPDGSGG